LRINIPDDIATEVLFKHDRTCCVCQERGKTIQIHHIDDDPSNNGEDNLTVLCLACHNDTQIKGGFGRSLSAPRVIKYRDDWIERVSSIRKRADEMMVQRQLGVINDALDRSISWQPPGDLELATYIESIPDTMKRAYAFAQPDWNTGATNVVAQATYQLVHVAERLWIGLSAWYPPNQFNNKSAPQYIDDYIASRYDLRYALMEPNGPRTSGTMIRPMVAYGVLRDIQELIALTVRLMLLFNHNARIDIEEWNKRFAESISSYSC
jgi:hypothetical protein